VAVAFDRSGEIEARGVDIAGLYPVHRVITGEQLVMVPVGEALVGEPRGREEVIILGKVVP
jgi:hypothetical protein